MTVAVLVLPLGGCTPEPGPPEPTGSAALYAELEVFGQTMIDDGAPAVLMQVRNKGEEWSRAMGVRNLDTKEPVQLSDPVEVASITKSMLAVAVLKLAEEGRIKLDDPVSSHLPEFGRLVRPPGPISVRDLLNHGSGMPDYGRKLLESRALQTVINTKLSLSERLALAGTIPWPKRLAPVFTYSESNYAALGLLVEKLRGRPVGDVIRDEITRPLGMAGTFLSGADVEPPDMVHGYVVIEDQRVDVSYPEILKGSTSAGVVSTVQDMNTFYAALMQGKLLQPATVKEMQTPGLAGFYGLGLWILNDTCTNNFFYGHPGDFPGYGTVSLTSADGTRQVTVALTYPPAPYIQGDNPLALELRDVAERTLNRMC